MFTCWAEDTNNNYAKPHQVNRADFTAFMKAFMKTLSTDKCSDIFMNQLGKLKGLLGQLTTSPNQSRLMDDSMSELNLSGFGAN